jgi:alanyl-tRNA synthetase
VRNTAEIGLFRIVSETGVAAGVRRIEALTGPAAFEWMRDIERELARIEELVGASPGGAAQKVESLVSERGAARHLSELMHAELMRTLIRDARSVDGVRVVTATVEVPDVRTLQLMGDVFRGEAQSGVAVLAAHLGTGKSTVLIAVTDDLSQRGVRADTLVREITSSVGGRGGGKAHMAQAGVPDASLIPDMLARVPELLTPHLRGGAAR